MNAEWALKLLCGPVSERYSKALGTKIMSDMTDAAINAVEVWEVFEKSLVTIGKKDYPGSALIRE